MIRRPARASDGDGCLSSGEYARKAGQAHRRLVPVVLTRYARGMKRMAVLTVLLLVVFAGSVAAQAGSVALGVGAGVAVPARSGDGSRDASFAWGFHVNIPILNTLHLSPSSELYQTDGVYATDIALAFKFMIPLRLSALYLGIAPGLTAAGSTTSAHVGALGGLAFRIVSNISGFAQYKYKVLFYDDTNARMSHLTAGLLFSF